MAPYFVIVWVLAGGLPYAVAAERRGAPRDVYAEIRASGLVLTGALGLLGAGLLFCWASVVGGHGIGSSYAIAALAVPFTMLLAVFVEYERQAGAGRHYNLARLLPSVASALVVVVLSIQGVGRVSAFVVAAVVPGALVLVVLWLRRLAVFQAPLPRWNRRAAGPLLRIAVKAWPSAVTDTLLLRADQVALSLLAEARGLGLYAVAATISEAGGFLRASLCANEFASLAAAPGNQLRKRRRDLHARVLIATVPAYAFVGIATFQLAGRIFGAEFQEIGPMVLVLLGAQVALDVHLTGGTLLLAIGQPAAFSKVSIAGLSLHLVVLIPAVYFAGAMGAALASLVGYAAAGTLSFIVCSRKMDARKGCSSS